MGSSSALGPMGPLALMGPTGPLGQHTRRLLARARGGSSCLRGWTAAELACGNEWWQRLLV
eukprot:6598005-Alexandrium_andersonii.AAC.1